ncbi:MAG: hypothetical protein AAFQ42_09860 [Pseudomonadota bacterium]
MATAYTIPTSPNHTSPSLAVTAAWTLAAGLVATVIFDAFGQHLAPALGWPGLAPVPLARQVLRVTLGLNDPTIAHALHWFTGIVGYALGYVLVARPVARIVTPWMPGVVVGTIYGVALWVFALYVMAHLVAGNPPFLGFGRLTWVALAGHVVYGVVLAAALGLRRNA